ncbi:hypothetical protein [Aestuariibaculum suncheonense]|uniref:Lipoprotein n=1 Tax=Aestuariibaculum suncheonense TaxID=1028745 RepID=A0A8J6QFM4_9FLAO|nr:hypothetical protein [Aestuariibaculum suncheonense]MBD0835863.1 hypothetical protein [Aestuariibaculum suncheonense]
MNRIKLLIISLSLILFFSCEKDDVREELPGTPTSISGTVKDYHRNLDVNNFEIKLIKYWLCPDGGMGPNYCTKEIATTYSDIDGNYQLDFDYNLRSDENYLLAFNETENNTYYYEFVSNSGEFYRDYDTSNLVQGENNILNLNAFIPIKLKFNLTVLNNHTPPLITGIEYNDNFDFGTEFTYDNFESFERKTRPNSEINIKFWYIENYNSNSPIFHYAPVVSYQTDDNELTELNFEIDCNEF